MLENNQIRGKIKIDLTNTRYKVIKECAQELDWEIVDEKRDDTSLKEKEKKKVVDLFWYDGWIDSSKLGSMKRF